MNYIIPSTLDEALAAARAHKDHAFLAGGTDVMVKRAEGNNTADCLIDIGGLAELRGISAAPTATIGAATTLAAIAGNSALRERFPTLVEAALSVASPNIRAAATIGGNLLCENRCVYFDQSEFWRAAAGYCLKCNGNVCIATGGTKLCYAAFISDVAPVLICLDANVEYAGVRGGFRSMPVEQLYSGDGLKPHTLPRGALLTRIAIPRRSEGNMFFRKIRPRASVDFTNLTLAMRLEDGRLALAASGIGPAPIVVRDAQKHDAIALAGELLRKSQIIDNLPYKRLYRKEMLGALIGEGLEKMRAS